MLTREQLGWGPRLPNLAARNYTHVPKVKTRDARRHKALLITFDVLTRDRYRCRKCGHKGRFLTVGSGSAMRMWCTLTIDHVVPESCGGSHDMFNLTTLCRGCNTRRGAYYPNPVSLV